MKSEKEKQLEIQLLTEKIQKISGKKVVLKEREEFFGIVNIHIDGEGFIKNSIVNDIKKLLFKYQGERHLFVDEKEINPYK